jgi:chondroitin 4-sulfotransferase 11
MISHKKKFVYIHIPKTAGMSLRAFFRPYKDDVRLSMGHPYYYEYLKIFEIQDYYNFACVRNPFDRLVSAFLYIKKSRKTKGEVCLKNHFDISNINFNHFVTKKLQKAIDYDGCRSSRNNNVGDDLPRHFHPQSTFLIGCNLNGIIRFESLKEDLKKICKDLNIRKKIYRLRKTNVNKKRKDFREYYDKNTRKIVRNLYRHDFEMFDYDF